MLGVNSKSHILTVHPRVKEIVAAWGGEIADEGQDGDEGGNHSTEKGGTCLEEKAG